MSRVSDPEKRNSQRVEFARGVDVQVVAIDGTWARPCKMTDVSKMGAKLTLGGSIEGLAFKEFFLLLSTTGTAYRRCELAWINGEQVGVRFISGKSGSGKNII
ncbi:PilZ domain-containing protein [Bradyrhizobium sp. MOS002]|uniref:PilZ domain-containing protein n=1 Tax=Bradyrhizobium sp. MOS002 TaxID=2133947 RepID=UPI000D138F5A|nr:PilZ domain-containing protein [Bradyrhizobium sp. MOS002]PSO26041.1 hypothetical protein C7G41_28635 [Bradyrhizobium sp. MOS002]